MHRYAIAAALGALLIGNPPAAQATSAPAEITPVTAAAVTAAAVTAAAVTAPPVTAAPTSGDPWEHLNRRAYAFQDQLLRHVIRPVAHLYRWLTPGPIGRGLHNVFVNLTEPVAFINDMLQLRFKRAAVPAARFMTNSTIGLLGLFDVAGRSGLPHHDNEFGVTLGRYRLASGPYLYVPLVGPTTVRDLFGSGVDILVDPVRWVHYNGRSDVTDSRLVVGGLDTEVSTEPQLDALLSGAMDPYATLRSAFLQNKQGEVEGGGVPADLPSFDEPAPMPAPAPVPPDGH